MEEKENFDAEENSNAQNYPEGFVGNFLPIHFSVYFFEDRNRDGNSILVEVNSGFIGNRKETRTRISGFKIRNPHPLGDSTKLKVEYMGVFSNKDKSMEGWTSELCGRETQGTYLEQFAVKLTGEFASNYVILYVDHSDNFEKLDDYLSKSSPSKLCGKEGTPCRGLNWFLFKRCCGPRLPRGYLKLLDGVYSGKGDYPQGTGVYIFANKEEGPSVYDGQFERGLRHGFGVYYLDNGDIYMGDWKEGKREGRGRYEETRLGSVYIGEFRDNEMHGKGEYLWKSGKRYKGDFLNGEITGGGVLRYHDGKEISGVFQNGKLQYQFEEQSPFNDNDSDRIYVNTSGKASSENSDGFVDVSGFDIEITDRLSKIISNEGEPLLQRVETVSFPQLERIKGNMKCVCLFESEVRNQLRKYQRGTFSSVFKSCLQWIQIPVNDIRYCVVVGEYGSGKTMALSVLSELVRTLPTTEVKLIGRVFVDFHDKVKSDLLNIWRSIALQLAIHIPQLRNVIAATTMYQDPDFVFENAVLLPLMALKNVGSLVLVIDDLYHSYSESFHDQLLRLPLFVKFIVCIRESAVKYFPNMTAAFVYMEKNNQYDLNIYASSVLRNNASIITSVSQSAEVLISKCSSSFVQLKILLRIIQENDGDLEVIFPSTVLDCYSLYFHNLIARVSDSRSKSILCHALSLFLCAHRTLYHSEIRELLCKGNLRATNEELDSCLESLTFLFERLDDDSYACVHESVHLRYINYGINVSVDIGNKLFTEAFERGGLNSELLLYMCEVGVLHSLKQWLIPELVTDYFLNYEWLNASFQRYGPQFILFGLKLLLFEKDYYLFMPATRFQMELLQQFFTVYSFDSDKPLNLCLLECLNSLVAGNSRYEGFEKLLSVCYNLLPDDRKAFMTRDSFKNDDYNLEQFLQLKVNYGDRASATVTDKDKSLQLSHFNIAIVGDSGVGKTSLIKALTGQEFVPHEDLRTLLLESCKVKMNVLDNVNVNWTVDKSSNCCYDHSESSAAHTASIAHDDSSDDDLLLSLESLKIGSNSQAPALPPDKNIKAENLAICTSDVQQAEQSVTSVSSNDAFSNDSVDTVQYPLIAIQLQNKTAIKFYDIGGDSDYNEMRRKLLSTIPFSVCIIVVNGNSSLSEILRLMKHWTDIMESCSENCIVFTVITHSASLSDNTFNSLKESNSNKYSDICPIDFSKTAATVNEKLANVRQTIKRCLDKSNSKLGTFVLANQVASLNNILEALNGKDYELCNAYSDIVDILPKFCIYLERSKVVLSDSLFIDIARILQDPLRVCNMYIDDYNLKLEKLSKIVEYIESFELDSNTTVQNVTIEVAQAKKKGNNYAIFCSVEKRIQRMKFMADFIKVSLNMYGSTKYIPLEVWESIINVFWSLHVCQHTLDCSHAMKRSIFVECRNVLFGAVRENPINIPSLVPEDNNIISYKDHNRLDLAVHNSVLSELHTHLLGMGSHEFWVEKVMCSFIPSLINSVECNSFYAKLRHICQRIIPENSDEPTMLFDEILKMFNDEYLKDNSTMSKEYLNYQSALSVDVVYSKAILLQSVFGFVENSKETESLVEESEQILQLEKFLSNSTTSETQFRNHFKNYIVFNVKSFEFEQVYGLPNQYLVDAMEWHKRKNLRSDRAKSIIARIRNCFSMLNPDGTEAKSADLDGFRGNFTPCFYPMRYAMKDPMYFQIPFVLTYLLNYVCARYVHSGVGYVEFSVGLNDLKKAKMRKFLEPQYSLPGRAYKSVNCFMKYAIGFNLSLSKNDITYRFLAGYSRTKTIYAHLSRTARRDFVILYGPLYLRLLHCTDQENIDKFIQTLYKNEIETDLVNDLEAVRGWTCAVSDKESINICVGLDVNGDESGNPISPFAHSKVLEQIGHFKSGNKHFGVRFHGGESVVRGSSVNTDKYQAETQLNFATHLEIIAAEVQYVAQQCCNFQAVVDGAMTTCYSVRIGHGIAFNNRLDTEHTLSSVKNVTAMYVKLRKALQPRGNRPHPIDVLNEAVGLSNEENRQTWASLVPEMGVFRDWIKKNRIVFEVSMTSNHTLLSDMFCMEIGSDKNKMALQSLLYNKFYVMLSTDDDGIWPISRCTRHKFHISVSHEYCRSITMLQKEKFILFDEMKGRIGKAVQNDNGLTTPFQFAPLVWKRLEAELAVVIQRRSINWITECFNLISSAVASQDAFLGLTMFTFVEIIVPKLEMAPDPACIDQLMLPFKEENLEWGRFWKKNYIPAVSFGFNGN